MPRSTRASQKSAARIRRKQRADLRCLSGTTPDTCRATAFRRDRYHRCPARTSIRRAPDGTPHLFREQVARRKCRRPPESRGAVGISQQGRGWRQAAGHEVIDRRRESVQRDKALAELDIRDGMSPTAIGDCTKPTSPGAASFASVSAFEPMLPSWGFSLRSRLRERRRRRPASRQALSYRGGSWSSSVKSSLTVTPNARSSAAGQRLHQTARPACGAPPPRRPRTPRRATGAEASSHAELATRPRPPRVAEAGPACARSAVTNRRAVR